MQRRDLLKLSKTELAKRCKKSRLPTNGSKAALVDRLMKQMSKENTIPNQKHNKQHKNNKRNNKNKHKHKTKKATKHQKAVTMDIADTLQTCPQVYIKTDIMEELQRFNYNKQDIFDAIDHVIDKNDINAIMTYIEKKKLSIKRTVKPHRDYDDDNSSLSSLSDEQTPDTDDDSDDEEEEESDEDSSEYTPKPSVSDPMTFPSKSDNVSVLSQSTASMHYEFEEKKMETNMERLDMTLLEEETDEIYLHNVLTPSKRPSVRCKSPKIPNKLEMIATLQTMDFCMDRILRAFKVYERNYGTRYKINGLIELIQRLTAKDIDNNKKSEEKIDLVHFDQAAFNQKDTSFVRTNNKSVQISPRLFVPHMTMSEAESLCLFDNIDHRDSTGRFCVATIIHIDQNNQSNVKIHYEDDLEDEYDLWSDYRVELFRFAKYRSISRRKQFLFVDELKIGDRVNVNPPSYYVNKSGLKKRTQWNDGMITAFDKKSAQVQIAHKIGHKWFIYWTHVDNIQELSKYSEKSALPSTFYKFKNHSNRKHLPQSMSVGQLNLGGINLFNQ